MCGSFAQFAVESDAAAAVNNNHIDVLIHDDDLAAAVATSHTTTTRYDDAWQDGLARHAGIMDIIDCKVHIIYTLM